MQLYFHVEDKFIMPSLEILQVSFLLPDKEQRWARTISLWVLWLAIEAKVGGEDGSTFLVQSKFLGLWPLFSTAFDAVFDLCTASST
jgi:hypothetical protein